MVKVIVFEAGDDVDGRRDQYHLMEDWTIAAAVDMIQDNDNISVKLLQR